MTLMASDTESFYFGDYPEGPRRDTARRFAELAMDLSIELPDGEDKEQCLRLLLKARGSAVTAAQSLERDVNPSPTTSGE